MLKPIPLLADLPQFKSESKIPELSVASTKPQMKCNTTPFPNLHIDIHMKIFPI